LSNIRKFVFGVPLDLTSATRHGFPEQESRKPGLEKIGEAVTIGYHRALELADTSQIEASLAKDVERGLLSFAIEGAAMGFMVLDTALVWNRSDHIGKWLKEESGKRYRHLIIIGAGLALGRIRFSTAKAVARLDPVVGWFIVDGYGFLRGFLDWKRFFERRERDKSFTGYGAHVFDQGLGRALWFVDNANVKRVADRIASFDEDRRGDLWSGVGIAACYAGNADQDDLTALRVAAGKYAPELALGAMGAAQVRVVAGNIVDHTELASRTLTGLSPTENATLASTVERDVLADAANAPVSLHELYRQRVIAHFAKPDSDIRSPRAELRP